MSAGAGVDTSVAVGAVRLPNPVIAASGTFGYGTEFAGLVDLGALGALAVKGLSLRPSPGKPAPRLVETPGGMLNSIGLQNIGVEAFLGDRLPALRAAGARVVANFWGDSPEEFAECAARLDGAPGVVALELNASSPNRPEWGSILATDPQALAAIVRAVRARVRAPLWVKLSPNVGDITRVGRAAEDALEFLCCGARAVQVGTATFYDPRAPLRIAEEMARWCRAHGVGAISDVIGTLRS